MSTRKNIGLQMTVVALLAIFATGVAMAQGGNNYRTEHYSVMKVLSQKGHFKTLVKALKVAGLDDTLDGTGPFTVFAPTDAAFDRLPKGALEELLNDPEKLKSVLLFHVVSAKLSMNELERDNMLDTANGAKLPVTTHSGRVYVGRARVIRKPATAENGIVYAISEVLMPPAEQ